MLCVVDEKVFFCDWWDFREWYDIVFDNKGVNELMEKLEIRKWWYEVWLKLFWKEWYMIWGGRLLELGLLLIGLLMVVIKIGELGEKK